MRPTDIEAWALDMLDRKEKSAQFEDDRVEHKEVWPTDYPKIARRVAGLCNAARGEPVLLIIGPTIQEAESDDHTIVPAPLPVDPADWFSKLEKEFDSVSPDHQHIAFSHNGKHADAILFHTDRAPYVVRNPVYGKEKGEVVSLEVPWRDGTRTRTAKREELIRILVPVAKLPSIEVADVSGWITAKEAEDSLLKCRFSVDALVYIVPTVADRIYLTQPSMSCEVAMDTEYSALEIERLGFRGTGFYSNGTPFPVHSQEDNNSKTITLGTHEIVIEGPGYAFLFAMGIFFSDQIPQSFDLRIALIVIPGEQSILIPLTVAVVPKEEEGKFDLILSS